MSRLPILSPRALLVVIVMALGVMPLATASAQTSPPSADRYGTAAQAAMWAYPDGADVAVLASGETFADALGAAPLAAAYDAPILLSGRDVLPDATRSALAELGVGDILVMGGAAAISDAVTNSLHVDYQVMRVAGDDRYGTASQAARDAFEAGGASVAVLASGESFADALAAAPLAAAHDAPILLTDKDVFQGVSGMAMDDLGVADILVMGGPAAISTALTDELELSYQVSRVAGADRYATAAQAARDAFPEGASVAVLASGEDFPDALAAGPLAAAYDAPILLTGRDALPDVTRTALADLGVADILVMGGAAAISDAVTNSLHVDHQISRIAGGPAATRTVEVFFANDQLGDPCGEVFPRPREVPAAAPLHPTLEALLAGPTAEEQADGYAGWFSDETAGMLQSVQVEDGVAHVDFDDLREVIPNASTSCGSAGLLAQLDRTATQFDTVDATRYSILGDQAAFYEWLQMEQPG